MPLTSYLMPSLSDTANFSGAPIAQALRVLLYDMLMSQEEANAQLLLRVSAAVLAWPTPLENVASSEDLLGQAVQATIRDMCTEVLSREERQGSEAETAADTDSGTSSAIDVNRGVWSLLHLAYLCTDRKRGC